MSKYKWTVQRLLVFCETLAWVGILCWGIIYFAGALAGILAWGIVLFALGITINIQIEGEKEEE